MKPNHANLDPVYVHARREAVFILLLFAVCAVWSLSVGYLDGYQSPGETWAEVPLVLGMPRWVFWGIFMPWLFADAVTIWFVFRFMVDDDLGEGEHSGKT